MNVFRRLTLLIICFTINTAQANIVVKPVNDTITVKHKFDSSPPNPNINTFDIGVLRFFQRFSRKSVFFDRLIVFIAQNDFLKGGIMMIAFWWLWFLPRNKDNIKIKAKLILVLFSSFLAIFMGRLIVLATPFRARPVNYPSLHLKLPVDAEKILVDKLTSMPSDHAVMFFSICTGLFLVNRKVGIAAFFYAILFITFSRVYLCYHWATDVICGAVIGIVITIIICADKWMLYKAENIYRYSEKRPQLFYSIFFFVTYELGNMFEDVRSIITFLIHA